MDTDNLTLLKVNLIPAAVDALDEAADLAGLSRTDVVNRALQAYAALLAAGLARAEDPIRLSFDSGPGRRFDVIVLGEGCPQPVVEVASPWLGLATILGCLAVLTALCFGAAWLVLK